MDFFASKVVLITGGAGCLGISLIREILTEGVKGVAIVDKSGKTENLLSEDFCNDNKKRVLFVAADITNSQELEKAFQKTINTFKQLDIVINSAAIINEVEWKNAIAVNFTALTESTYLAMQKYLFYHKSGIEGCVVNIASDLGFNSLSTLPVYSSTKHAVIGLGQALGTDEFYKIYKVKVLTVCPGPINTPLITEIDQEKYLFPENMRQHLSFIKPYLQEPASVAKAVVKVLRNGENGSLWVARKNELFQVLVPDPRFLKVE